MLRGLFESAPDTVVVVNHDGRIVRINPQAEQMFGYYWDELLGKPVETLIPERFREQHVIFRAGYLNEPHTRPMGARLELYGKRKDGSEFSVDVVLSPMEAEDGPLVIAVARDITERKRVEEQIRSSLREKEVLLKEIHHRVKNNLQVITSLLNLQSRYLRDQPLQEVFKESQNRVRSMALVHEKLYQSKELAPINAAEYIHNLTTNLLRSYGTDPHKIRHRVEVDEVELGVDTAIPCGLLVNEMVSNALKHAFPEGRSGEIRVELRAQGDGLLLRVSDDGVGLPEGLDFREADSLGLQLVNALATQLDDPADGRRGDDFRSEVRRTQIQGKSLKL
ncbi:MAG TPA: histidine kinase dimerization/phosphoacceptor domain -containing protein [Blastocatellia bacterium]|nr:histidine kinase dimerization/phosphoacceptor domain -containing protein [Blastocatellia bacterium]